MSTVQSALDQLKRRRSMSPPHSRRRASGPRKALRRPYEDGVKAALEVIEEYEKELAKIK